MADPGPGPRAAHHRPPRTAQSSDEDIPSSEEKEEEEEEEGYESLDEEEEVDWQERCEELEGVIETLTKRLALNEGGAAHAECASHDSPDASQTSFRFTSLPTASAVVEVPILPSSATSELAVLSDTPVDPLSLSPTILELEAEIAQIQLEMELIREFNALSPDQIEKFKLATLRHSKFAGQTAELLQGGESFASKFHAGNGLMRMIAEARDNVRRIAGSTVLGIGGPKLFKVSNRAKKHPPVESLIYHDGNLYEVAPSNYRPLINQASEGTNGDTMLKGIIEAITVPDEVCFLYQQSPTSRVEGENAFFLAMRPLLERGGTLIYRTTASELQSGAYRRLLAWQRRFEEECPLGMFYFEFTKSPLASAANDHSKIGFSVETTTSTVILHLPTGNMNQVGIGAYASFATSEAEFVGHAKSDESLTTSYLPWFPDGSGRGPQVIAAMQDLLDTQARAGRVVLPSACLLELSLKDEEVDYDEIRTREIYAIQGLLNRQSRQREGVTNSRRQIALSAAGLPARLVSPPVATRAIAPISISAEAGGMVRRYHAARVVLEKRDRSLTVMAANLRKEKQALYAQAGSKALHDTYGDSPPEPDEDDNPAPPSRTTLAKILSKPAALRTTIRRPRNANHVIRQKGEHPTHSDTYINPKSMQQKEKTAARRAELSRFGLSCPICPFSISTMNSEAKDGVVLARHTVTHGCKGTRDQALPESGVSICKICGAGYKTVKQYRKHIKAHKDDGDVHCTSRCGKSFHSQEALDIHLWLADNRKELFSTVVSDVEDLTEQLRRMPGAHSALFSASKASMSAQRRKRE